MRKCPVCSKEIAYCNAESCGKELKDGNVICCNSNAHICGDSCLAEWVINKYDVLDAKVKDVEK